MSVNNKKKTANLLFQNINRMFRTICLVLLFSTCIEEFSPILNDNDKLLVIDGSIIKEDSIQTIKISRSKPIDNTTSQSVSDCEVTVSDDLGNVFPFEEVSAGNYQAAIPESYLKYNTNYSLQVTSNGKVYESDPEPLLRSSEVDKVYYRNEPYQSSSELHSEGLQFYIDLEASEDYSRNYRWKLEESFEYHSLLLIDGHYSNPEKYIYENRPSVDSLFYCWSTIKIRNLFSSSTKNLTVNKKKQIPLNYVAGTNKKLFIKYSLLVKQYALSDPAYEYWNRKKVENTESGGLYQSQPSQSKSNIHNINNPNEIVLGFFWVSSYTEKRIFFEGPLIKTPYYGQSECLLMHFDRRETPDKFPYLENIFLTNISSNPNMPIWNYGLPSCYDCTIYGGVTYPPDFWNE